MATRALLRSSRRDSGELDILGGMAQEWDAGAEEIRGSTRTMREYADLMPEPGFGPLSFADFPFQEEWYSEEVANAPEVVFAKGAQVGASAYGVRWAIREVDQFADIGLYVMPTLDDVFEFGDERIEPAIEESEYLRRRITGKHVKNKRLKRIGRGFLHMRGSNSKSGAQSVPATFLFLDEADLLDQTNLPMILRRVSGARQRGKQPKIRYAGYPLLPNTGIDLRWKQSDQRVWHVVCPKCGDEQPVSWEENVRWTMPDVFEEDGTTPKVFRPGTDEFDDREVVEDVWRQCRSCEASFEDPSPAKPTGALRTGRWVAQNPGAHRIGFHVWRGMVPTTDLRQLVVSSRGTTDAEKEAFSALDLGRAHVTGESQLDEATLLRACGFGIKMVHRYDGPHATTMGVDVAGERDLNVQIDEQLPQEHEGVPNPRQSLWIGRCSTFEEVAEKMELFRVHVCAIDSNPERRPAKALRAMYPGRVILVEYDMNWNAPPLKLELDEAEVPLKARVHRTDAIDGMMDSVRQVRWRPVQDPPAGWVPQMKALIRRTELDSKGRPIRVYVTSGTEGDDYAHAATYGLVATELWRSLGIAQERIVAAQGHRISEGEMGFRRVRLSGEGDAGDYQPGLGWRI